MTAKPVSATSVSALLIGRCILGYVLTLPLGLGVPGIWIALVFEWVFRVALQFLLTEAVILFLAFRSPAIDTSRPAVLLSIAGSVLVIFLLAFLISWLTNAAQARQVNAELLDFQRRHGGELG